MPWHVHLSEFAKGDPERLLWGVLLVGFDFNLVPASFCLFVLFCLCFASLTSRMFERLFLFFSSVYFLFTAVLFYTRKPNIQYVTLHSDFKKHIWVFGDTAQSHLSGHKTDVKTFLSCLLNSLSCQHCWCNWALGYDGVISPGLHLSLAEGCTGTKRRQLAKEKGGRGFSTPKIKNTYNFVLFFKMSLNLRVNNKGYTLAPAGDQVPCSLFYFPLSVYFFPPPHPTSNGMGRRIGGKR